MVSKTQNNITFLCVGFILGFVSGYSYKYRQKTKTIIQDVNTKPEPEPEPEPVRLVDPTLPVNYVTTYRDTYATLDELVKTKSKKVPGNTTENLSLRQKYSLMEDFSFLISLTYSQGCRLAASKGYNLHIFSVEGFNQQFPSKVYSNTTFGIEIRDPNYNFQTHTPSKEAQIVSIINVGGKSH